MSSQGSELIDPTADASAPVRPVWRMARITFGVILLIIGIAGLVLPIVQGWLTILAALAILSKDLPWAAYVWDHWLRPLQARVQRWLPRWRRQS